MLLSSSSKPFAWVVTEGQEKQVAEYFNYIYADCDDILDANAIADMTGLNVSTVIKLLQTGEIKSLTSKPKYLVPKQYLMDFVVTRRFLDARTTSELFRKIIGGFELWQNAKLSQ